MNDSFQLIDMPQLKLRNNFRKIAFPLLPIDQLELKQNSSLLVIVVILKGKKWLSTKLLMDRVDWL